MKTTLLVLLFGMFLTNLQTFDNGFSENNKLIEFEIFELNTIGADLHKVGLIVKPFCLTNNEMAIQTETLVNCTGNWIHQGNGCFKCKGTEGGTFSCCDGDSKKCNSPDIR